VLDRKDHAVTRVVHPPLDLLLTCDASVSMRPSIVMCA